MFDFHHDLLSICLFSKIHQNDKYLAKIVSSFHEKNVIGVFSNLYFMKAEEMMKAYLLPVGKIDVVSMFCESKEIFDKLFSIPVIYSIEGCDYIKDERELEKLYHAGLDAFLLVWNNPNLYGSGNRGEYGLTEKGKLFLRKAIDLGMGIDLSHANRKTFFDMIDLIKEEQLKGKDVICYASHSNSYELCPHPRNLTKEQLLALKEVGGMIGVVSYPLFVGDDSHAQYITHIRYMVDIFGIDNVMVSSDNMDFVSIMDSVESYPKGIYAYDTIKEELESDLLFIFSSIDTKKILVENGKKLYYRIKEKRKNVRY